MTDKDNSKSKTYGEQYVMKQYQKICIENEEINGFRVIDRGDNHWEVQIFEFAKDAKIVDDIKEYKHRTGKDYISLHVTFPESYPDLPPFIRVAEPRLMPQLNGPVTKGGSIVSERISKNGWRDSIELADLIKQIVNQIRDSNIRIDFEAKEPYSVEKAKVSFKSAARELGYNISFPLNELLF